MNYCGKQIGERRLNRAFQKGLKSLMIGSTIEKVLQAESAMVMLRILGKRSETMSINMP